MVKLRRNSRAQSLSEYVLLIAVVTAALIGMQTYMKRGVQGVVQVAADAIGDQKKGLVEVDYDLLWKMKGYSNISTTVDEHQVPYKKINKDLEGRVTTERDERFKKEGILSQGMWSEKE